MHESHPDWTARQIADELGCAPEQVHVAAKKASLLLPRHLDNLDSPVWFRVARPYFRDLEEAAHEHGLPVNQFAKTLIEMIVKDDLFKAVLDKGADR